MNVLVTTRKRLGHVFERKKGVKRPGEKSRLTNAKIESLQTYFIIALRQKAGDRQNDFRMQDIFFSCCYLS